MGMHASHLEGLPMAVGRAWIERLGAHATSPRFVYRHQWQAGDVMMWDNRCLLYRADTNFDAARYPRVLHRTCLRGTRQTKSWMGFYTGNTSTDTPRRMVVVRAAA
jgi:alpha-ketoglutarate-dependent taurine dioxygenase